MPETQMEYNYMELPEFQLLPGEGFSTSQLQSSFDATIVVFHDAEDLATKNIKAFKSAFSLVTEFISNDQSAKTKDVNIILNSNVPGGKLITAPTGPLLRDQDDVRRYAEATLRAMKRVKATGTIKKPLIVLQPPPFEKMEDSVRVEFEKYYEVASLAALTETYESFEARETLPELSSKKIETITVAVVADESAKTEEFNKKAQWIRAIETGRRLARDIGGPDPEMMTAIKAAEVVKKFMRQFDNVKVDVIESLDVLKKEYPLLGAVARASEHVPRHAPRVLHLSYRSPDQAQVTEELFLVGKGINYDTGGADVKVGGNMVGMSRDKCGAAAMAGFMATCALLEPKHLNVTVALAFVRNSIGSNSYVSDEIIRSRAGIRVRVGNTDAEGRMIMADVLAQMKERALSLENPQKARIFTCATLTGHAARTYGPYVAAMDNGPARLLKVGERIKTNGQQIGDCVELSTLRREDYDVINPRSNAEDVLQAGSQPSVATSRGHQYPAAFLQIASGLNRHGLDAAKSQRLAYTHLDIAGAAEELPGPLNRPTATPIAALAATFLKN